MLVNAYLILDNPIASVLEQIYKPYIHVYAFHVEGLNGRILRSPSNKASPCFPMFHNFLRLDCAHARVVSRSREIEISRIRHTFMTPPVTVPPREIMRSDLASVKRCNGERNLARLCRGEFTWRSVANAASGDGACSTRGARVRHVSCQEGEIHRKKHQPPQAR